MLDERYEDEIGEVSGTGGSHKRVSWAGGVLFAKDDDEYHDPWSKKGKRNPLC